jgi:hypothetical protein
MHIQKLWQLARDQWKHPNEVLHHTDTSISHVKAAVKNSHLQDKPASGTQCNMVSSKHPFPQTMSGNGTAMVD